MSKVTRRDFLNGVALTIAAGLTPMAQLNRSKQRMAQPGRYPPALTGMRGQHEGSFEVGHELRDRKTFPLGGTPIDERYDLVVVGGGISGLAAAWFYRRARPACAHPGPRQSRRLRRPRQAQRVPHRRPADHRLRRQRIDAIAQGRSTATSPRACSRILASISRASKPPSSARSIRRWDCRAACSFRARRSGATRSSPAIRRPSSPTISARRSQCAGRCASSSRNFPSRPRARRS